MFGGITQAPYGYKVCDGTSLSSAEYPAAARQLGAAGSIILPDIRSRYPVVATTDGDTQPPGTANAFPPRLQNTIPLDRSDILASLYWPPGNLTPRGVGETGGVEILQLNLSQLAAHYHKGPGTHLVGIIEAGADFDIWNTPNHTITTSVESLGLAFTKLFPYVALLFVMKVRGLGGPCSTAPFNPNGFQIPGYYAGYGVGQTIPPSTPLTYPTPAYVQMKELQEAGG
jgi:hypothetical protein